MGARRPSGEGTVYRRKDGRFEAACYVTTALGKRRRLRAYGDSRAEALALLDNIRERERSGLPIADENWTVEGYLSYWLEHIVKRTHRPHTYQLYEQITRNYLVPNLGATRLSHLRVILLQQYFNDQLAQGRSVRTVQKQRTVLSAALTRAMREEILPRNVARLVQLPRWQRKEITTWTSVQVARFLDLVQGESFYPIFVLLVLYGLRRGEVLGLRWQDVDFSADVLRIRQQVLSLKGQLTVGPVKTDAGQRDLPLLPFAREVLLDKRADSRMADEGLIFQSTTGRPIEPGNLLRAFLRICRQHGLPRITLHHLRHTTATLLKNTGVPARDAQLILGHAHISTTQQLYQHADLAGQQRALSQIEQLALGGDSVRSRQRSRQSRQQLDDAGSPRKTPSLLETAFFLVAPPRLELGTQGSSTQFSHTLEDRLTSVRASAISRYRQSIIGCVAVNVAVNVDPPDKPEQYA
ncbi:tyrosine-type recombinase/integrase [Kribbella monticola]|uniref:tyrosine-type recombinase/integrase n=1 Tax=Kribbella monticola TaxID=2185285 RepID=UPI000DD48F6E|nr:site-specific integrase [Kribbella monticola]